MVGLDQPSRKKLEVRIAEMPLDAEVIHRRVLSSMTPEERDLIVFALKWVLWGSGEVTAVEVAEHYKQVYDLGAPNLLWYSDDARSSSFLSVNSASPTSGSDLNQSTHLPADPEIHDIICHLKALGRDFIRVDDDTGALSCQLSVQEWIYNESIHTKGRQTGSDPVFTKCINGQWLLTLPIPGTIFFAFLKILISLMIPLQIYLL